MRLYQSTQVSQKMCLQNRKDRYLCRLVPPCQVTDSQPHEQDDDLIKPRKLPNPIQASHQHRALHQELMFCYRRGVLPRQRPELHCVLEVKLREQHRQKELALHPPTDFEVKLRSRQQRLQSYELEEKKRCEDLKNIPEFVHVRQTLRHIPNSFK